MTNQVTLQAKIDRAEADAARSCGLSDVLYEKHAQAAYANILEQSPESEKGEVMRALKERGFDPDFSPFEPEEGQCRLTGINEDCCPCGRHL